MTQRQYTQRARAESTEQTRRAILDSAQDLFREDFSLDFGLERVAERAGCSTRTIIRQFGSKEDLFEAAMADAEATVMRSRLASEPGDLDAALGLLVAHYEEMGDEVVRMLAASERYPLVRKAVESGARLHRTWAETVFARDLEGLPAGRRRRRLALLTSVTDVYLWHLLRRRQRLGREATEASMLALVETSRRSG